MKLVTTTRGGKSQRYLQRGDSEGYVTLWEVPDVTLDEIKRLQLEKKVPQGKFVNSRVFFWKSVRKLTLFSVHQSKICTSLSDSWTSMNPPPVGILDQLNHDCDSLIKLTASIYLPQQSRLVVGREDGSIIIVPGNYFEL